jgi:Protein of unknown function (DUF2934)
MTPVKVKFRSPASHLPGKSLRKGAKDMLTPSKQTEKSSLAGSESRTTEARPTDEEIELYAYQIYIERGCADGHDVDDWLQAEHELSEKYANSGRIARRAGA